jgi:predicted RNase H-like HicB family nuclease
VEAKQRLHGVFYKDPVTKKWVAQCIEIDVATCGDDFEHARAMLKEAVELHVEDMTEEELDDLYIPVEGDPKVAEFEIDAATVLHG